MSFFCVAERRRSAPDGFPVPDVPGLEAVRWRWIAADPWWYFEVENELAGETAAPGTYPNGVRLDSPCINEWHEPEEARP
jgi:hypothetical protein